MFREECLEMPRAWLVETGEHTKLHRGSETGTSNWKKHGPE